MVSRPPSVDSLATSLDTGSLPRSLLVEVARRAIDASRTTGDDAETTARAETERLAKLRPHPVINATGVLLHTNLGRAQVASDAAAVGEISASHASSLEFDLTTGARGSRGAYTNSLLTALTGADAALAVNNTAGALFLALAALAGDRPVIVSRGELIEIGGSFRLPELMAASGARLLEVGTTNRTRLKDYRRALDGSVGLILKVHPSNYRIEGFTDAASYAELGTLAAEHGLPLVADIGSGLLDARVPWLDGPPPAWLAEEPAVRQTLADGASLVLFSGDKLLGGPQAGIAVGAADVIEAMRSHPVARAVRIAGPSLDMLAMTLEMYAAGRGAEIPFWAMASFTDEVLEARCSRVVADADVTAKIISDHSLPGAGTVPGKGIPGPMILISCDVESSWRSLLEAPTPIVGRRDERGLIIDLRAVSPVDDGAVAAGITTACR
ncbi:MAG: L-seryl-tRNA(Sec) selenium transferase [Acidimicrobiia bacterium]